MKMTSSEGVVRARYATTSDSFSSGYPVTPRVPLFVPSRRDSLPSPPSGGSRRCVRSVGCIWVTPLSLSLSFPFLVEKLNKNNGITGRAGGVGKGGNYPPRLALLQLGKHNVAAALRQDAARVPGNISCTILPGIPWTCSEAPWLSLVMLHHENTYQATFLIGRINSGIYEDWHNGVQLLHVANSSSFSHS